MGEYRIVASDLDGTLLNRLGEVSEENWQAIREMAERGVQFVPCTGRTLNEMAPEIRDNSAVRYIIHSDGAVVYDKQTGERVEMCMTREIANQLWDILNDYPNLPAVRYQKNVYMNVEQKNDATYDFFQINGYSRYKVIPLSKSVENFEAFCRSMEQTEMVGVFFQTEEDRTACEKRLIETGDYFIIRWSGLTYLEICQKSAGKGNALLALARHLGYGEDQTIGVGDSTNDLTMIQSAGLGIAVSNACDLLKQEAGAIICSNDEHAIKYIFEHYIEA